MGRKEDLHPEYEPILSTIIVVSNTLTFLAFGRTQFGTSALFSRSLVVVPVRFDCSVGVGTSDSVLRASRNYRARAEA